MYGVFTTYIYYRNQPNVGKYPCMDPMGYEKGRFSGDVSNTHDIRRPGRAAEWLATRSHGGGIWRFCGRSPFKCWNRRDVWRLGSDDIPFLGESYFSRLFTSISKLRSSYYILRLLSGPFSGSCWRFLGWNLGSNCEWTLRIIGPSNGSV